MPAEKSAANQPRVSKRVGLALRAHRRALGASQRRYAELRGLGKSFVAKAEVDAAGISLGTVEALLEGSGFRLAVVDTSGAEITEWESTDLVARDRAGRRFPATRAVRRSRGGPMWWTYHEFLGSRPCGPAPEWTAEGFAIPSGVRYGKVPLPYAPGEEKRWPH
ncbi:MAG: hypothetical protein Q4P07_04715 [Ornithinimicrobium sp.]|uniref:helix-turn-helix domain-containing protein n=1 Tax=Ornithinimicrobium sp. TaxID=1977084 RepID=UPI0026E060C3|nr:hypothetical protein [Ornithinimicrobium sp.]MDO5739432.1 hypothetical protein [Ornithinimicrobium sp.]